MPNVSIIMEKYSIIASRSTSIWAAERLMKVNKIKILPILEGERLIGIVRIEDLKEWRGDKKECVEKLMQDPVFVLPEDDIDKASKIMLEKHITRLPVVNNREEMKFLGVVTSTGIANAIKMGIE